jgi:uncharacterized phage protein (predicted DNA packaging)
MYVTLEEAKKHLNIDDSFKDDDSYINSLILVAEDAIEKNTDIALNEQMEGDKLPPSVIHSILLLVGNLYANREATTYSSISDVPYSFKYLVNLNRNF